MASIAEGAFAGLGRLFTYQRCSCWIGWRTVVGLTLELLSRINRLPHRWLAHGSLSHSGLADHRSRLNRLTTRLPGIIVGICLLVLLWVDGIGGAIVFAGASQKCRQRNAQRTDAHKRMFLHASDLFANWALAHSLFLERLEIRRS